MTAVHPLDSHWAVPKAPLHPSVADLDTLGLATDEELANFGTNQSEFESADATVDGVVAAKLIDGQGRDVNGFVVKANALAETGYGKGQAFMVLEEGAGDATLDTAAGSVMFRVDRHGNIGTTGGLHVATGLRNADGQTQAVWIDPSKNMVPLVIHNPTVADSATWDKSFIEVVDTRNANEVLFKVDFAGAFIGRREMIARDGAETRVQIGATFGFAGIALGSGTDTLIYRREAAVVQIHNVIQMQERADPAAPVADGMRLYARDNGAGKTQLCVRFNTGAIAVLATQP